MPTRKLYTVIIATGERHELLTLHSDGTLTAEVEEMVEAVSILHDRRGLSNEFIFEYMKNQANAYVKRVEEVVED